MQKILGGVNPFAYSFLFPVTGYLFHVAKLNQLVVLSQQLEEDIRHLGSHKYIAHQLSVIYVRRESILCFHLAASIQSFKLL